MDLLGIEFGAGALTGPVVRLCLLGCGLFAVAIRMAFVSPRPGAAVACIAAVLCLPLDAYRIAPASLPWLTSAPAAVRSSELVHFDAPAIESMVAIIAMLLLHLALRRKASTA